MNKFITKVAKLVLGLSLAAGVGVAVGSKRAERVDADTTASWTVTSATKLSGTSGTFDDNEGNTWSWSSNQSAGSFQTTQGAQQIGANGSAATVTFSTSDISGTISEVAVECASYQGKHTVSISVGDSTFLAATATPSWTTVGEKSGTGSSSGEVLITFTPGSGARAMYIKSISVTYSSGPVVNPDFVLNRTDTPFTSTSGSNTGEENVTVHAIQYHNYAGYNYNTYLSFNRSANGYLGNNTSFAKNIAKIVVDYNSGGSSYFSMYEGSTALSETTLVSPSKTGTGAVTYTFSDSNPFFKLKLTTTGTYCNINSISIYLGSNLSGPTVSSVTVTGNMSTVSYNTVQSWSNSGLTATVSMSDSSSYTGDIIWEYSPVSPAAYAISNEGPVTNGEVTATANALTESGSKISSGISVVYATVAQGSAATPQTGSLADVLVKGIVSQVDEVSTSNHNATYYISDNGTTTGQVKVFRGRYVNNADFTSTSQIQVGDEVLVYGTLTMYNSEPQFTNGNYLISLTRTAPAISITESNFSIGVGDSDVTLHETHENLPSGASIKWFSGTPAVATIGESTGVLHAVSSGTTDITAKILDSGDNVLATSSAITVTVFESAVSDGDSFIVYYGEVGSEVYFTGVNDDIGTYSSTKSDAAILTAVEGATSGQFALSFDSVYLSYSGSSNKVYTSATNDSDATLWTITNNGSFDVIESVNVTGRYFKYNTSSGSERFCCYTSASNIHIEKVIVSDPTTLTLDTKTLSLEAEEESTALTFTTDSPGAIFSWYSEDTSKATVSAGVVTAGTQTNTTVKIYVYFDTDGSGDFDPTEDLNDYCTVTIVAPTIDYSAVSYGGTGVKITSSNASTYLANGKKIIITYNDSEVAGAYGSYIDATSTSVTFGTDTVTVGNGTAEVSVTVLELETATGGFYLKTKDGKYLSHTSTNAKAGNFAKTDSGTTIWSVSADGIYDKDNQAYATIRCNTGTNPDRFKTYAPSTGAAIVLYSFNEYVDEAETYADIFLESGLCGSNDNTKASSSIWGDLKDTFNDDLSTGAQNILKTATANPGSTDSIQKCLAKYDRVIYLHYTAEAASYPDFMNRISGGYVTPIGGANVMLSNITSQNTNTIAIIVIISLVSVTAIGGYFFIKRREQN